MNDVTKEPSAIFIENLAAITGNNALVKLDLADDSAMQKRFKLVESRRRKLETYHSAVLVYFCNVLESKGFAENHKDKIPATVGVADVLAVAWVLFDTGRILKGPDIRYKSLEDLSKWLDGKLTEVFSYGLDPILRPTAESLNYILEDFERVSKIHETRFTNH